MDLSEALDLVVARTGHKRFRELLDPNHPDFNPAYEETVVRMALGFMGQGGQPPGVKPYPPLAEQVANAVAEGVRQASNGFKAATEGEAARRLEVCRACDLFDAADRRCRQCGCYMEVKVKLDSASCPLDPPKWGPGVGPGPLGVS